MGLFSCFSAPAEPAKGLAQAEKVSARGAKLADQPVVDQQTVSLKFATPVPSAAASGQGKPETAPSQPDRDPLAKQPSCRYRRLRDLNNGSSGFVQLAEDCNTQQQVAIKFLERGTKIIKDADREICNLRLCCMHPYIIRFREAFLLEEHLAIVSDYASMGDMADYIEAHRLRARSARGLPEAQARQFFQQLMLAVDFCHKKGIVNRDLKLENILLTPSTEKGMQGQPMVKLCDFGFSKDEAIDSICKTACGTPEYVAPEVLLYNQYSGKSADMWSAGVILYVMLTGRYPFREPEDERLAPPLKLKRMFPRIVRGDFARPPWMTHSLCHLLAGLLCVQPEKRFTVSDVLTHPWFQEGLPQGAADINTNLLQISDMLLTSFTPQTEDQILTLVQASLHKVNIRQRPSKQQLAAAAAVRKSLDVPPSSKSKGKGKDKHKHRPMLDTGSSTGWSAGPPVQETADLVRAGAPDFGPLATSMPDESLQRWRLPAAHCSDESIQAMLPSQRFRAVNPALLASTSSSQYSHMASTVNPLSSSGTSSAATSMTGLTNTGLTNTIMEVLEESPGSSYDDLIADAGIMTRPGEALPAGANPFAQTPVSSSWRAPSDAAAQPSCTPPHSTLSSPASSTEPRQWARAESPARSLRSPVPSATLAVQPGARHADRPLACRAQRDATCQNNAAGANPARNGGAMQNTGDATLAPRHAKQGSKQMSPAPHQRPAANATLPPPKSMVSPFAMVKPSGGEQLVPVKLPANLASKPNAPASRTPDLPSPARNPRAVSATTSLSSALSLGHAQSNFNASSSDADFAYVLDEIDLPAIRKQAVSA